MKFFLLRQVLYRITIRQKLLAGAWLILLSMLAVSISAVLQFRELNGLIGTAVTVDGQLLLGAEDLKDLLVAQMGNARKFAITGDPDFRRLFDENTREFRRGLSGLEAAAGRGDLAGLTARVGTAYEKYLRREPAGRPGSGAQDEGQAVGESLEALGGAARAALSGKLASSQAISSAGSRIALAAALGVSLCGALLALLIGRSIYVPLQRLKQATQVIAGGDFGRQLPVERQDEIGELSASFNQMTLRLLELDRLKSDFIASISHDLKTPLASISEADQLMLDGAAGELTDRQRRLLGIIREDAARLSGLISSIIDLARMESGTLRYDFRPADPCLPAGEAVESVRLLAEAKRIDLSFAPGQGLPQVPIDEGKLRQALINLVSNAIKFTPEGGAIAVAAAAAAMPDGRRAVRISVEDSGPGIPDEDLPRIFEKFYHGRAGAAGTGLGLTIASHIVQGHGGTITAESRPGGGSAFHVLLPAAVVPES